MVFASWKKIPHNDSFMIEHNGQFIPYRKLLNLDPYDWWLVVSLDLVIIYAFPCADYTGV